MKTPPMIITNYSNRRIVSAFHPPCWCLRPWEMPFNGEPFARLEFMNGEYDKNFGALWILVFEHAAHPLIGYCVLPRDFDLPTTKKRCEIYAELTAMQRVAIEIVNGRLGHLIAGS